jgi:hypothetical protein
MACQFTTLPIDCLHEILEYFEKDIITLHSCLLVNRLLCRISVRILWREVGVDRDIMLCPLRQMELSFFNILIACLPNESNELLNKNEIFISTHTLKTPLFNYATFCKVLSISGINSIVDNAFKNNPLFINPSSISDSSTLIAGTQTSPFTRLLQHSRRVSRFNDKSCLVTNELIKMFVNQASLKVLTYYKPLLEIKCSFPCFPGMKNLLELHCYSNIPSDFFHQLSQTCHNLQTISITFDNDYVTNELKELISLQNNLKILTLRVYNNNTLANIMPSLKNHSNMLTKLHLYINCEDDNVPLSFVSLFINLQEIIFSFVCDESYINIKDFEKLQYINFPKLQTLKIPRQCPKPEYLMKFLETNGKNLKKIYISEGVSTLNMRGLNNDLNLTIANFCPNVKRLIIRINDDEIDVLKTIFINCQYLEFIKIWCEEKSLTETIFEIVTSYSPKNFCELILYNSKLEYICPGNLESFFLNWKDRNSEKLLTLTMISDSFVDECDVLYNKDYYEEIVRDIIDNYNFDNNDYENDEDHFSYYNNYYSSYRIYFQNLNIVEKYENLGIIKFSSEYNNKEEEELDY